jgi:hypothetical protein
MFWRVYFWAYLAWVALSLMGAALRPAALALTDWIDLVAFAPLAITVLGAQAFGRSLLPEKVWQVLLFASVFWKSIALGSSIPKLIARVVDLNTRMGVVAAEIAIVAAVATAALLVAPPLIALYHKGYPDGDLSRIRLPGPRRGRRSDVQA